MKKTLAVKKKFLGFTLIELLAVVTIMAILFAIGLVTYTNAARNARNSRRRTDITNLRQALVLYRSDNGAYPDDTNDLLPDYWSETTIPLDPKTGDPYSYVGLQCIMNECVRFILAATLETTPASTFTVTNP